jgi:hypothetical protein
MLAFGILSSMIGQWLSGVLDQIAEDLTAIIQALGKSETRMKREN